MEKTIRFVIRFHYYPFGLYNLIRCETHYWKIKSIVIEVVLRCFASYLPHMLVVLYIQQIKRIDSDEMFAEHWTICRLCPLFDNLCRSPWFEVVRKLACKCSASQQLKAGRGSENCWHGLANPTIAFRQSYGCSFSHQSHYRSLQQVIGTNMCIYNYLYIYMYIFT